MQKPEISGYRSAVGLTVSRSVEEPIGRDRWMFLIQQIEPYPDRLADQPPVGYAGHPMNLFDHGSGITGYSADCPLIVGHA